MTIAFVIRGAGRGSDDSNTTAWLIASLTVGLSIVMVPFFAHRNITYMKKVRQKALFEVSHESGASPSDADWENKVYRLFSAFDTDDSGDIDSREMREMVAEMYSFLPQRVVKRPLIRYLQKPPFHQLVPPHCLMCPVSR